MIFCINMAKNLKISILKLPFSYFQGVKLKNQTLKISQKNSKLFFLYKL
jgi:hypothetical protein